MNLAVELDILEVGPQELSQFAAYAGKCSVAAHTVMNNSGIAWRLTEMRVSPELHDGDIQWFASNVQRTHRIRPVSPGEYVLTLAPESNYVVIRQVEPGIRVLCPLNFVAKTAAAVEFAEAARRFDFLDRDDVLASLFDTACTSIADRTLDVDTFIAGALLSSQYIVAAHVIAPERRPS